MKFKDATYLLNTTKELNLFWKGIVTELLSPNVEYLYTKVINANYVLLYYLEYNQLKSRGVSQHTIDRILKNRDNKNKLLEDGIRQIRNLSKYIDNTEFKLNLVISDEETLTIFGTPTCFRDEQGNFLYSCTIGDNNKVKFYNVKPSSLQELAERVEKVFTNLFNKTTKI